MSEKVPLAAVRGFYLVGDQVGKEGVTIDGAESGKRSFAEAFATAMGVESPASAAILISFQKRPHNQQGDSSELDNAVEANCRVFNEFAHLLRADFDDVKAKLNPDLHLEQLGCKTVNRVLRVSHICDFAAKSVVYATEDSSYVPNWLFI